MLPTSVHDVCHGLRTFPCSWQRFALLCNNLLLRSTLDHSNAILRIRSTSVHISTGKIGKTQGSQYLHAFTMGSCLSLRYQLKQDLAGNTFSHYSLTSNTSFLDLYPTIQNVDADIDQRTPLPMNDDWGGQTNLEIVDDELVAIEENEHADFFFHDNFDHIDLSDVSIGYETMVNGECPTCDCDSRQPDDAVQEEQKAPLDRISWMKSFQDRFNVFQLISRLFRQPLPSS